MKKKCKKEKFENKITQNAKMATRMQFQVNNGWSSAGGTPKNFRNLQFKPSKNTPRNDKNVNFTKKMPLNSKFEVLSNNTRFKGKKYIKSFISLLILILNFVLSESIKNNK